MSNSLKPPPVTTLEDLQVWLDEHEASCQMLRGADGVFTVIVHPSDEPRHYESASDEELATAVRQALFEWENSFYEGDDEAEGSQTSADADTVPPPSRDEES